MVFPGSRARTHQRVLRAPHVTVARLEMNSTEREDMMQSAPTSAKVPRVLRPTQLVAEALIDRHDPEKLTSRARQLGYSRDLTETVVAVCCRNSRPCETRRTTGSAD